MGILNNLTGLTFGFLYVESRAETRRSKTYWLCKCECGVRKPIRSESLLNGSAKSCGCARNRLKRTKMEKHYSLVNKRFGRLWVLWRAGSKKQGTGTGAVWECKCDCGTLIIVPARALREGKKSCGECTAQ